MPIVSLENVDVFYGSLKALAGVSCSIEGGAVGLLGPNGAGKSTLIKTLLGFVRPRQGVVKVFGLDMPGQFLEVRQKLGYMPEKEVISPNVSAVSFLTYCGELYGMTRVDAMERAHEILNFVGMGESRYRNTQTYSTGMLQRIKFAAALIHDPQLLLLDEPTNGLDPDGRVEMLELIRDLPRKRKMAVILSSHLLPDVEYVCDSLIMINKGHIVRHGAIGDITAVRDGLLEVRVRDNKDAFVARLEAQGCSLAEEHNGNLLVTKPPEVELSAFFDAARRENTHIRHLRPVRFSLEEAFMQAMKKE